MLGSLSTKEKGQCVIQNCFKEQTSQWRKELEAERVAFVPIVTCRICQEKFYADMANRHAQFCTKRVGWAKSQRAQNERDFLDLHEKLTNSMINMQSQASDFGSNAGLRRMSIVSSSSFQFLTRYG